jgi:glycerol-1-phosphate dehydrogenase [NAD(P)+]
MNNFIGIIEDLLHGNYVSPYSGKKIKLPIEEIAIIPDINDYQFTHLPKIKKDKNLIISGKSSFEAFGKKVVSKFEKESVINEKLILENYESTVEFAKGLSTKAKDFNNIICIGSGSVIDLCKYVAHINSQQLIVYCSSLSAAATTSTVSLKNKGIKESVKSKIPEVIVIDLNNLKQTPHRLLRSALGDVLCRTTCQVDWLTSHFLLDTFYDETPFALQYEDEKILLSQSDKILTGNMDVLAALARMTLLNGIAAIIIGSTHAGSMGEHLISHYIDMFMGNNHPGSLHGEQVGIATLLISKIQNDVLKSTEIPQFCPLNIKLDNFESIFDSPVATSLYDQFKNKYFENGTLIKVNEKLELHWQDYQKKLLKYLVPTDEIYDSLIKCGAPTNNIDLNIPSEFYNVAIKNAFYLRDRFSYLDISYYLKTIDRYLV